MTKPKIIATILMTSGLLFMAGCTDAGKQDQATTDGNPVAESTQTTGDSALSDSDEEFVMEAAKGGLTEVELGQLATQKATDEQVKQFAQRMVQDHTKANNELQGLAQAKNITLPTDIGDENRGEIEKLSELSGTEFDEAYIDRMVDAHQEDVELFERQAQQGDDPDLKTWAATTLPILQEHTELVRSIDSSVNK